MKPRAWVVWLRVAAGVLILTVLAGALALHLHGQRRLQRARQSFAAASTELGITDENPPGPSYTDNAAVWLTAGADAIVYSPQESGVIATASRKPASLWTPAERATVSEVLERNTSALRLLAKAGHLSSADWAIDYAAGVHARFPPLRRLLDAARLSTAEARLAAARGDYGRVIEATRTLGRLADSLEQERSPVTVLVGLAVERMQLSLLFAQVENGGTDLSVLADLAALRPVADPVLALRRGVLWDARSLATSFAAGEDMEGGAWAWPFAYAFGDMGQAELLETGCRRASEGAVPVITLPAPDAKAAPPPFYLPHKWLAFMAMPKFSSLFARAQLVAAQRILFATAMGLRAEAQNASAYPAALAPHLAGPEPLTGKSLAYERTDGGRARVALAAEAARVREVVASPAVEAVILSVTLPPPR